MQVVKVLGGVSSTQSPTTPPDSTGSRDGYGSQWAHLPCVKAKKFMETGRNCSSER